MPEYTSNAVQLVAANQNVIFTDTPEPCRLGRIIHREGSGLFTLRGIVQNCNCSAAKYKINFNANIAIPTGGAVAPISVALAVNGEAIPTDSAIVTPAAVGNYWNVSITSLVNVPKGCCYSIAIRNTSSAAINVQNASLVIEKG